jgi:glycosyltransferase involved in cell wall biosynthesis
LNDPLRGRRSIHTVALIGNHFPRRCGLAAFTTELGDALSSASELETLVVAMNGPGETHHYPSRVRFELAQGELEAYRRAADFLNANRVDVVSLQHEYGIFGGPAGAHVIALLRALRVPVVSTLHTVLEHPTAEQRAVLDAVLALSRRAVVMSDDAAMLLNAVHGVAPEKIDVIAHGAPGRALGAPKELLGVEDHPVILSFGLLSPHKGVEYVIDALPEVLERHPSALYVVLGATHPRVKQREGEAYRLQLLSRAERLGVSGSVVFDNRFVTRDELLHFVGAADLFVTPSLDEAQSTSGTLAFALGAGKAIVSTPFPYAREVLADGRGVLVPWRHPGAIAWEVNGLLEDAPRREALERRAAAYGASMHWPVVARRYLDTFERAVREGARRRVLMTRPAPELPELDLAHLQQLTDDTGVLRHATFDVPRLRDGYSVDDNAHALVLLARLEEEGSQPAPLLRALTTRCLAFIDHAFDETSGRFRSVLEHSRVWRPELASDETHGRALWALGALGSRTLDPARRGLTHSLFRAALPAAMRFGSSRGWAYALLALDEYLRANPSDPLAQATLRALADRLADRFDASASDAWPWFEPSLTTCNARLPQGLLLASVRLANPALREHSLRALDWLLTQQVSDDGTFSPIGTRGYFPKDGPRAQFDQLPVEACATVSACLDAHRVTGELRWLGQARAAFRWFLGNNTLGAAVYDARTGGCRDVLYLDRVSDHQSAEATLSFLASLVELRAADRLGLPSLRLALEPRRVAAH